jgi:hypothetical protein
MANKPGKYAAALAAINHPNPQQRPTVFLPEKPPAPAGKRSTAGWKQKAVLLKEESIRHAAERLKRRNDRTDFSDLMQALLEAWLQTPD